MKRSFLLLRALMLFLLLPTLLLLGACTGTGEPAVTTVPSETEPNDTKPIETEPPLPTEKTYQPAELAAHLLTTGRAGVQGDLLVLDWTWAKAEFEGEFLASTLKATLSLGYGTLADLLVVVDDDYENAKKITLTDKKPASYDLAELTEGKHNIKLFKATQALSGGINLHDLTCTAHLGEKPEGGKLKIHIIGDSITCGTGAMPIDRPEAYIDMAEYSYGALLSRAVDAEVSILSVWGWGVACGGTNYDALIPKIYDKTNRFRDQNAAWDFASAEQPDLVIIALGTNDYRFRDEGRTSVLIDACKDFVGDIRAKYPKAQILWVYGQMLNQYNRDFKQMVQDIGDSKLTYMDLPKNGKGGTGHPDAEGHREYCALLKDWIAQRFGESFLR